MFETAFDAVHDVTLANEIEQTRSRTGAGTPTTEAFVHDLAGNLVWDGQLFYQYDGLNRLVEVVSDPLLSADSFDPNGRPRYWTENSGTRTLAEFTYDGLGRLAVTKRRTQGNLLRTEHHYYDDVRRICDVENGSGIVGTVTRNYVWGPGYVDELIAATVRSTAGDEADLSYLQDAGYNVAAVIWDPEWTGQPAALQQFSYEPYGEVVLAEADANQPATPAVLVHRTGHQGLFFERFLVDPNDTFNSSALDPNAVGVYWTRNRAYSPRLGRWLSRDMNESAQPVVAALAMNAQTLDLAFGAFSALGHYGDGMSLYAYAGSNPVNRRDPLGLYDDPFEVVDDLAYEFGRPVGGSPGQPFVNSNGQPQQVVGVMGRFRGFHDLLDARSEFMGGVYTLASQSSIGPEIDLAIGAYQFFTYGTADLLKRGALRAGARYALQGGYALAIKGGAHVIAKWAGGRSLQWMYMLKWPGQGRHQEVDRLVRQRVEALMQELGVAGRIGGKGGSYKDWERLFKENPGLQRKVFDEVLGVYRDWDRTYGTNLVSGFWMNIMDQRFKVYP